MSSDISLRPRSSSLSTIAFPQMQHIFDDFDQITNRIAQRAFDLFRERGTDGNELGDWLRAESETLRPMPLELDESDTSYTLKAEVPGFSEKELTVQAEPYSVMIHAKKQQTKEKKNGEDTTYSEVASQEMCRRVQLPASIDAEKVAATLRHGVLELNLPKSAPPKSIPVKAA